MTPPPPRGRTSFFRRKRCKPSPYIRPMVMTLHHTASAPYLSASSTDGRNSVLRRRWFNVPSRLLLALSALAKLPLARPNVCSGSRRLIRFRTLCSLRYRLTSSCDFILLSRAFPNVESQPHSCFIRAKRGHLKTQAYKRLLLLEKLGAEPFLSERKLAQRLGMSNTPIRSAIERPESEGLIVVSPQRGLHVRR
jgi:biotin operon repressor